MEVTKVFEKYLGTSEADRRALEAERAIALVTERLLAEMRKQSVSKAELARRLGKSKSFVSATLDGSRNLTLRTLTHIAYVLGLKVAFELRKEDPQPKKMGQILFFANYQAQPNGEYSTSVGGSAVAVHGAE